MSATKSQPLRFDEEFAQNYPIATLSLEITKIVAKNPRLVFHDSWDDLDYLKYCILDHLPGFKIALVCHERSPVPGIDICTDPQADNFAQVVVSTLSHLGLTTQDLSWIHPDCLLKLQQDWELQAQLQAH